MMTGRWGLLLAASLVAVAATNGAAQDRTQDRTQTKDPTTHTGVPGTGDQDRIRDRDRLETVLKTDGKLSSAEVASVESALDGYVKQGGNQEQFQAMVRNSIGEGCGGVCLCEAVRSMNQFMSHGQDAAQARKSLGDIQREQKQQREQKKLALSDQQKQDQLRQRTMERTREQDRERTREHSAGSAGGQGAGAGAPQGGGKQGGK